MGDHMFNDLALSRDVMREYHARIADDDSAQRLSVVVLQRSVWPFVARKKDVDLLPSVREYVVACVYMLMVMGVLHRCKQIWTAIQRFTRSNIKDINLIGIIRSGLLRSKHGSQLDLKTSQSVYTKPSCCFSSTRTQSSGTDRS
jgi:hypothetical protein